MSSEQFTTLFARATDGNKPLPYQKQLGLANPLPSLLDIPTGLGKTAAAVLAWVWRRRFADEAIRKQTPRRLVYCLPMRVLVEQTYGEAVKWLSRLGLLAGPAHWTEADPDGLPTKRSQLKRDENGHGRGYEPAPDATQRGGWASQNHDQGSYPIAVHLLLGGEEKSDWALWPERDAILIGTQDMLISRALNRGYAAGRARWPLECGLLNSDCLWVLDEVQLMGSGLTTTAQLEAFAKKLWKPAKQVSFLWMSATLGDSFLRTRDRCDWGISTTTPHTLLADDYATPIVQQRLQKASKTLNVVRDRPKVTKILEAHVPGRISLLMLNTVPLAKNIYGEIREELAKPIGKNKPKKPQPEVCLLHSRFRQVDRERQMERLLVFLKKMDATGAVPDSDGLIVVSTQVLEAGFDLSSARLWSEIAPWPSTIQRLGRLNREGLQPEATATFWMPKADDGNKGDDRPNVRRVGPYEKKALESGKKMIEAVIAKQAGGMAYRDALDVVLATKESQATLIVEPEVVLRPDDFFELFSTEPDLMGGFTNVSQFVRDQDRDVDVHVFWRDFDTAKVKRPKESAPSREELCSVPFFEFRQFMEKAKVAWEWNFETDRWESRRANDIQPGMTLLLPQSAGGYRTDIGWTGEGKDRSFDVLPSSHDNDSLNADFLSGAQDWVSLADHLADVKAEMLEILQVVELHETPFGEALLLAAHWHDWGKSVSAWQDAVKKHIAKAILKLDEIARAAAIPRFDEIASEWKERLQSNGNTAEPWGKFPDLRAACMDSRLNLTGPERAKLSRNLKIPFRPNLRHEAASALAAWQAWLAKCDGLTALAVYLIACHHGKVRTVLRGTCGIEDVFGLTDDMTLQPIPGFFPNAATLRTDAKYVGACGEWDETNSNFTLTSPSWLQMIAELLGSKRESESSVYEVILENEPRGLGPLALAYYEALLRIADVRASRIPGKGGKS